MLQQTKQLGFTMACEESTGVLLRALAGSKPSGRFLEIGTGTGVGTAWILDGMDDGSTLITVDVRDEYQQVARAAFQGEKRLTISTEDAATFLQRQMPLSYDFIFADALAGKFTHLDLSLALVRKGGFFLVDDLLPQENWPPDHAPKVAKLIGELSRLTDFHSVSLAWPGGIMVLTRFQ
jgi:predicted O-methyltransferase YrrM